MLLPHPCNKFVVLFLKSAHDILLFLSFICIICSNNLNTNRPLSVYSWLFICRVGSITTYTCACVQPMTETSRPSLGMCNVYIPDHFNEQAANAIDFTFVLAFGEETMITILALGNCIAPP